jgi:hypothetical protein
LSNFAGTLTGSILWSAMRPQSSQAPPYELTDQTLAALTWRDECSGTESSRAASGADDCPGG